MRNKKLQVTNYKVKIDRLNEKGYGVGKIISDDEYNDRKAWVLNSLPKEEVVVSFFKKRRDLLIGKAVDILVPSKHRVEPKEEVYLASSPWEILDMGKEDEIKKDLIQRAFEENNIINDLTQNFEVVSGNDFRSLRELDDQLGLGLGLETEEFTELEDKYSIWHYRNKVELSFFGHEDETVTFAFFMRGGSFKKIPFVRSELITKAMNQVAKIILDFINQKGIRARQLKSLVLRYSYFHKKVVAILYVKDESLVFDKKEIEDLLGSLEVGGELAGMAINYSNPKSPASVITEKVLSVGETEIEEKVLDFDFKYGYENFFQVNPPIFELAVKDMQDYLSEIDSSDFTLVDLYAGVGVIGLLNAEFVNRVIGVEVSPESHKYALENARKNGIENFEFIETSVEKALFYIEGADVLVVDPPRSGMADDVLKKIQEELPPYLFYLSCNFQTQARDLSSLLEYYDMEFLKAYNFYPHTPHVETLVILKKK